MSTNNSLEKDKRHVEEAQLVPTIADKAVTNLPAPENAGLSPAGISIAQPR